MSKEKYSFNWNTIKRIHHLNKLIISNYKSIIGMIMLLSLSVGNQYLVYEIGIQSSKFYDVIGNKLLDKFYILILKLTALVLMESIALSIINYIGGLLSIWWRQKLTDKAHNIYLDSQNRNYYKIMKTTNEIDNPDQRIAHDIDQFSLDISQIFIKSLIVPFIIAYYTYQMAKLLGIIAPLVVYGYFIIGTLANKLLMGPLVNLIYNQEKYEGNFRAHHLNLRSNCEEVALLSGEHTELLYLNEEFNTLQNNKKTIVKKQLFLDCSTNIFSYIGSCVSYFIVGIGILKFGLFKEVTNQAELGTLISLSSFYTMMLIYNFSLLIELSVTLSDLAGYTSRIYHMFSKLEESVSTEETPFGSDPVEETEEDVISFDNVTFRDIKKDHVIIKDLSFKVSSGNNTLIVGRSGIGKSSIIRVISKLWPIESGKIKMNKNIFFLPQNPYLFSGTIFSQISYPLVHNEDEFDTFCDLLKIVKLDYILKRFNSEEVLNWQLILSPGEQQKLCLARLLYHKPSFAVLDEATSSLGLDDEENFYKLCTENQITLLSIGHRPTLVKYHQSLLMIKENGKWELNEIDEEFLKKQVGFTIN